MFHQNPLTVETLWLTKPKRIFTLFLISQNVAVLLWLVMLVVGLIDIQHMQSVIKGFFFPKNCYYFSDLETQWPRNPELSEGVGHNIEEKKSQLCFRTNYGLD